MDSYTLNIPQGTDFVFHVKMNDVDLTNYTARGKIKQNAQMADSVADFHFEITPPIDPDVYWIIKISLTNEETSAIPVKGKGFNNVERYYYDIELVSPDLKVMRILQGECLVSPEITK